MKTKINYQGKEVEITLTDEQIRQAQEELTGYRTIKTVEDAFTALEWDYESWMQQHSFLAPHALAYLQLTVVAKAINGGEWMDYSDTEEYKYYPYFSASGSASGFSCYRCSSNRSYSDVGSRLCFKTKEQAIYAGQQFINLYNQFIN